MKRILLFCCFISFVSCQKKQSPDVSFYYWKTVFQLSGPEKKALSANQVKKLYIRYFDVALVNDNPFPVAPIHFRESVKKYAIVPVIFIRNDVFLSESLDVKILVSRVLKLITQINTAHQIQTSEIQIDCDWSLKSRDRFMEFMRILKLDSHKTISATIRLHQVKYFKETRIPPVDYGVLMFYNMGKLGDKNANSIYDAAIAKRYLPSLKDYPLKLNVALPVFSWIVHTRNSKIVNLISKTDTEGFRDSPSFESVQDGIMRVRKNVLLHGFFFKEGDELKTETVSPEDLEEMSELLHQYLPQKPNEIIYYDLDNINIKRFQNECFFKANNANF
jgi:hypothetical protein